MTTLATILALSDQSFDRLVQMVVTVVLAYLAYKTQAIGKQVNRVETNTNSLTEQLVRKTEAEALSRGGRAERDQAEERGDVRGAGVATTPDPTPAPPAADPSIKARIEQVRVQGEETQDTADEIKDTADEIRDEIKDRPGESER